MRGSKSTIVGLVVPDIQNDFYATLAKVVADSLAARSMQLVLSVTEDNPVRELRELRTILELRPAGVITVPSPRMQAETEHLLRSQCTVQLLRKNSQLKGAAVVINDQVGIELATRHLLDYGHRNIAYIGGAAQTSTGRDRLRGFTDAHQAGGWEPAVVMLGPARPEFGRHAVTTLMQRENPPTGLILGSSELTLGALQALRALDLQWPEDVSVVGYHDPAWFELAERGITTVRLPVSDVAIMATSLVTSRADEMRPNDPNRDSVDVAYSPSLVLRHSTRPVKPSV